MDPSITTDTIIESIKVLAILFAIAHFGAGLIMFRGVISMHRKVQTKSIGCLRMMLLTHILILAAIILLIIFV